MDNLLFYLITLVLILSLTYLLRKNPKLKNEIKEGIDFAIDLYQDARELVGEEVFDNLIEEIKKEVDVKKDKFINDTNNEYNENFRELDDAIYEKLIDKTNIPLTNQQINFVAEQLKKTVLIELEVEQGMKSSK